MNEQLQAVLQRRSELLAEIAAQRGEMAQVGARWQRPLAFADQGVAVVRYLRARPLLVAGAAALLMWRRHGLGGIAKTGWKLWKGYRLLSGSSVRL